MATSGNGWPVLTGSQLHWFSAAGGRFAAANTDVAYVAAYLINRFDAEVENIDGKVLDDWSYASRPVRGQTSGYSNHASATAFDLNALKHVRGAHGTFSSAKTAAVRKILDAITADDGTHVFRWGNDYQHSTIDSMHFEINVNAAKVKQAVARLKKKEVDDVSFKDQHTLTAADAAAYGGTAKKGDKKSYDEILRFPPSVARLRRETAAQFGALNAVIGSLTKILAEGGSLTEQQAVAAAEAGANAALVALGHDLIDDDPA